ncbi:hypothetical protein IFM89_037661 [Coptis chinensis]|uniref:GH18 domain-containing protein n=1 Tax=Coptis chinensis TaxID=261450 RepID=A0A835IJA4_9MAGN|nr:hypothetical protein IFM89_037661 [Coptis chinensis]
MTFADVENFNRKNGATVVYDKTTVSTYSFAGTSWIGYDDPRYVSAKIGFAKAQHLGGYFFWAISGDNEWKVSSLASKAWDG